MKVQPAIPSKCLSILNIMSFSFRVRSCCFALVLFSAAALSQFFGAAHAAEVIRSFEADVTVETSGEITVRETLLINVEQLKIRNGIIRSLPVRYQDDRGAEYTTQYEILSVRRNERSEPFDLSEDRNHLNVKIGRPDVPLDRMVHRYEITYRTSIMVGFFESYDEVYWNVTGLKWDFPIEQATVRLVPPEGTAFDRVRSYTGPLGSKTSSAQRRTNLDGSVVISTTATLQRGEGLTVAAIWPKGFVSKPPLLQRFAQAVGGYGLLPIFAGYGGLLMYFVFVWLRAGKDPKAGPLVPRYYPPTGLGPAALRYVRNMGVDDKTLTSAILSLAVKRYLTISEQGPNEYFLERTFRKRIVLTKAERAVADALYHDGPARFDVGRVNHARLAKGKRDLETALKSEYEKAYFILNTGYVFVGALIGIALLIWLALSTKQALPAAFLSVWLGGWGVGTYEAIARTKTHWLMAVRKASVRDVFKAIFSSGPAIIMVAGFCAGFAALGAIAAWGHAAIAVLIIATCAAFYHWMKAPTRLGRRLLDEIDGFKSYLMVAEQDRMNFHNPPQTTPDLFEKYLPHAMALDVENEWSELFEDYLSQATRIESGGVAPYRPAWYYAGGTRPFAARRFSNVLSAQFASSIARAATAPTRPGGGAFSSGGGFSGGGGGGGGGSGW